MGDCRVRGRAWTFGDEVDTDVITPGQYLHLSVEELSEHVFEPVEPEFARKFEPGGILVAGRNFGCGSSRETAPRALQHLGVAVVIAESFGRIFFRNAVAVGLPVLLCPCAASGIAAGDEVEVDLVRARVTNCTTDTQIQGVPLSSTVIEILRKGGLMNLLREGTQSGPGVPAAAASSNEERRRRFTG